MPQLLPQTVDEVVATLQGTSTWITLGFPDDAAQELSVTGTGTGEDYTNQLDVGRLVFGLVKAGEDGFIYFTFCGRDVPVPLMVKWMALRETCLKQFRR